MDEIERQSELLRHMRILRRADVRDVIASFGGLRPMATQMNVAVSTVQGWKDRKTFPENRLAPIAQKIAEVGIVIDVLDPDYVPSDDNVGERIKTTPFDLSPNDSSPKSAFDSTPKNVPPASSLGADSVVDKMQSVPPQTSFEPQPEQPNFQQTYQSEQSTPPPKPTDPDSFFKRLWVWFATLTMGAVVGGGLIVYMAVGDIVLPTPTNPLSQKPQQRTVVVVDENNTPLPSQTKALSAMTQSTPTAPHTEKALGSFSVQSSLKSYGDQISDLALQNQLLKTELQIVQDRLKTILEKPSVDIAMVADLKNQLAYAKRQETLLRGELATLQFRVQNFETKMLKSTAEHNQKIRDYVSQQVDGIRNSAQSQNPDTKILRFNQMVLTMGTMVAQADTGRPFAPQAERLRLMFADVPSLQLAVGDIVRVADTGVMSHALLHHRITALLPQLQSAKDRPEQVQNWWDFAKSSLARAFTIRRTTADTPTASPVAHIADAVARQDFVAVLSHIMAHPNMVAVAGDLVPALKLRITFDGAVATVNTYLQNRMLDTPPPTPKIPQ